MARYTVQLLAPEEGFGQGFFGPLGKKRAKPIKKIQNISNKFKSKKKSKKNH